MAERGCRWRKLQVLFVLEFWWQKDRKKYRGGGSVDIFNRCGVPEDQMRRHESQAECEETEEARQSYHDNPMDITDGAAGLLGLGDEYGHDDKHVRCVDGCICCELDEELVPVLTNHASYPWTEVIHLETASPYVAAMVTSVWLPIRTCLTPQR